MKYKVQLIRTLTSEKELEADNREQALERARDLAGEMLNNEYDEADSDAEILDEVQA